MNRKAQINIEFLASAGLFLVAVISILTANQVLPNYSSDMERMNLNLEAKTLTDQLLTEEGFHTYGEPGIRWEENDSTLDNTNAVGIAQDHHVIDRAKLEALQTTTVDGSEGLNYSEFKQISDVNHQYRFNFVWLPTVQANYSFTKSSPPSDPPIQEPNKESYDLADNRVHYGTVTLRGVDYNFLITAHNGVYDSVYVSQTWDFSNSNPEEPYNVDERILENDFYVESFQNRENDRGSLLILKRKIKDFGPTVNTNTQVVTLDRYAVLENEPVRIEVSVW